MGGIFGTCVLQAGLFPDWQRGLKITSGRASAFASLPPSSITPQLAQARSHAGLHSHQQPVLPKLYTKADTSGWDTSRQAWILSLVKYKSEESQTWWGYTQWPWMRLWHLAGCEWIWISGNLVDFAEWCILLVVIRRVHDYWRSSPDGSYNKVNNPMFFMFGGGFNIRTGLSAYRGFYWFPATFDLDFENIGSMGETPEQHPFRRSRGWVVVGGKPLIRYLFIGPRYTWGPIYESKCLSLSK